MMLPPPGWTLLGWRARLTQQAGSCVQSASMDDGPRGYQRFGGTASCLGDQQVCMLPRYEQLLGGSQEAQGATDLQADSCAQIKQVLQLQTSV